MLKTHSYLANTLLLNKMTVLL